MSEQQGLFQETYEDAIRDTVSALGGFKKVGNMLWPTIPADDAGRKLANCLNTDKREKLCVNELRYIRVEARKAGVHILANFEMRDSGYAPPQPLEPEDERAALMREFVKAQQEFKGIFYRMERAGLKVA